MTKLTVLAARKEKARYNAAMRKALVNRILELANEGKKYREIGEIVGRSIPAVSRVMMLHGKARIKMGVRKPGRAKTHKRTCIDCRKVEYIRSDGKHTLRCADCARAVTCYPKGHRPANKGSKEKQVLRTCKTCQREFWIGSCLVTPLKKHKYRYGQFCSKPCYGEAMRGQRPDIRRFH